MKHIKHYLALSLCSLLSICAFPASRSNDVSAKMWQLYPDVFNPSVSIPDSLLQGNSAVIIANMVDINGDVMETNSLYGREGLLNLNRSVRTERTMVKILDEKARDFYSDFEFGEQVSIVSGVQLTEASTDFGARVIKPDGTIKEVDLSEALNVGHGKKGDKDKSRKIAIPGLETGDILDYYYIIKVDREEADLPLITVPYVKRYPTLNFILSGTFNKNLTVEVKPRNDAPLPKRGVNPVAETNLFNLQLTGLPAYVPAIYSNEARAIPALDVSILHNISKNRRRVPTSRLPGLHTDVPFGAVSRDIAYLIANVAFREQVLAQTQSMVKDYLKTHPDLTNRQIIDLAWIALCYKVGTDKNISADDLVMACLFLDLMEKMKLADESEIGIAFFKSRFSKPFNDVSRFSELDYGTIVGDTVYTLKTVPTFPPGEWPGRYQDEQGAYFYGKRKFIDKQIAPKVFMLPKPKATANGLTVESTANIDLDDETVDIQSIFKASGSRKSSFASLTDDAEWYAEVEELFAIPENKRYKPEKSHTEKRRDELEKSVKELAEWAVGTQPKKLKSYEILSRGIMPGSGAFELSTDCVLDGLISESGPDLLVKIGKMFYSNPAIKGDERTRINDIWLQAPENTRYKLMFNLPEGFTVKEEALKQLSNNVRTKVGQFFTSASLSDGGRVVVVDMIKRINISTIQAKDWGELLAIEDAAAAFNESILPLSKLQ